MASVASSQENMKIDFFIKISSEYFLRVKGNDI